MTRQQRRSAETRAWVRRQYEGIPCQDCRGVFHWFAMQFDHRPGSVKKFTISQAGCRSRVSVAEEIAKCDLLCANCHAIRTHVTRRPPVE
jgi:hypothetical protein